MDHPIASSTRDHLSSTHQAFQNVFFLARDHFLTHIMEHGVPRDVVDYIQRIFDYNITGGKQNRGMGVIETVEILKGGELSEKEYSQAATLGWAVEYLHALSLIVDDMMDGSTVRRGQPCWYLLEGIGSRTINDMGLLKSAIFKLLRDKFKSECFYGDLMDLFLDVAYKTEMGQCLDLVTAPRDVVNLASFSPSRHKLIVIYKTAIYTYYLPVALALLLCDFPLRPKWDPSASVYTLSWNILIPLGVYFQSQDDYIDYAGTQDQIGKVGTDIVDNKCSWCIVSALARASHEQLAALDAAYGRQDSADEADVKRVYREVDLDTQYARYEEAAVGNINKLIEGLTETKNQNGDAVLRKEVFRRLLRKIYRRKK
ncbi:farnesyl diphosphate synthase [Amylostereum chailletii]|nr:farnesyl diphosphate synthase [Amylostereum chailletii]